MHAFHVLCVAIIFVALVKKKLSTTSLNIFRTQKILPDKSSRMTELRVVL